tara:strand:- start:115 stop:579 length:465 start_codon:yes stop_codon:yes gene_type:complete
MRLHALLGFVALAALAPGVASAQDSGLRAGYTCVMWPETAETAEQRKAQAFRISIIYDDDQFGEHAPEATTVLGGPDFIGDAHVIQYLARNDSFAFFIQGSSRYLLTLMPSDEPGDFLSGLGELHGSETHMGRCTLVSADAELIDYLSHPMDTQ